jgi:glycosyltransferase involved in cell wall biosynthesis
LRFRGVLRAVRPAVVHAHFGTVTAAFAALAIRMGARKTLLVITFRGGDLNPCGGPLRERMRACAGRMLSQAAALAATRMVCVSGQLRDRLWWRRDRVTVLASGVDPAVFFPESRAEARRKLGWALEQPVVLFNAGHDPRIKRLDLAMAAVTMAQRGLPDLRLEILDGSVAPAEVPVRMNASDCLLLTSDAEGSPTVVQEALACGLPIVSVRVGDVVERLAGVAYTRLVERDADAIGRALADLVVPPRRTDGRDLIDEFSAATIAARLSEIYAELAAQGSGAHTWNISRC